MTQDNEPAGGGRKPVISNPVFSIQLAGKVGFASRALGDSGRTGLGEDLGGVYGCPYLAGGTEAKGHRSSHVMVGRVIGGTVPPHCTREPVSAGLGELEP